MDRIGECRHLGGELPDALLDRLDLFGVRGAQAAQLVTVCHRVRHDAVETVGHLLPGRGHCGRHLGGGSTGLPRPLGPRSGLAFGLGRTTQRISLAPNGFRSLLGGAHREPGFDLHGTYLGERSRGGLPFEIRRRSTARVGRGTGLFVLRAAQPLLEFGERSERLLPPALRLGPLREQPLRLGVGRPDNVPQAPQLLVDRGHVGVGLVQSGQRLLRDLGAIGLLGERAGEGGCQFLGTSLGRLECRRRRVDRGLHLEGARTAIGSAVTQPVPTRSPSRVTARRDGCRHTSSVAASSESTTATRSRRASTAVRSDSGQCTLSAIHVADPEGPDAARRRNARRCAGSQPGHRRRRAVPARPPPRRRQILRRSRRPPDPSPRRPRPRTRVDANQFGDGAGEPAIGVVLEQPGAAVLAFEPHRQRVDARSQRRHLLAGVAFGGLQFGDPRGDQVECLDRALVVAVEPEFPGVEVVDGCLDRVEFTLRCVAAFRVSPIATSSRATSASTDSARVRKVSTCPASRASPSRRSAIARPAAK